MALLMAARAERWFPVGLTALFVVYGAVAALHHECWRDEAQAFLVARDVPLGGLFHQLHYEGHPALWYLVLMPLVRLWRHPAAMQAAHLAIAAGAVYLFARFAPFSRVHRALFAFGYFMAYEYSVICRNYALGLLGLFAACALWPHRRARPVALAAVLALMAHSSVHALVIALALALALVAEYAFFRDRQAPSVAGLKSPPDSGWAGPWRLHFDAAFAARVTRTIAYAFFPLPENHPIGFWNSNLFGKHPDLALYLAVGVVGWAILALFRRPAALLFYVAASGALFMIFYSIYFGFLRHHGFFFMTFIAAAWVARADGPLRRDLLLSLPLGAVLAVQALAGARAFSFDYQLRFSSGRAAARYLRQQGLDRLPRLGDVDAAVSPVVAYLGADGIYYSRGHRYGSYLIWDNQRTAWIRDDENVALTGRLAGKGAALLILNHPLRASSPPGRGLTLLKAFTGSIDYFEDIYLYRYEPEREP
jgi:hypothetical protein